MNIRTDNRNRLFFQASLLGVIAVLALSSPAAGQWWRFGADAGTPFFTDLLFNNIDAINVDRNLRISADDLDAGSVRVRGRVEADRGVIGRVESSLDGGLNWQEIPFNERGLFAFEFRPDIERDYRFMIRAFSTTGQVSDELDHSFVFRVVREDTRALARKVFEEIIRLYSARDRARFMSYVSSRFTGNAVALDSALSSDFSLFDSIRITPNIQSMGEFNGKWNIYFSFNRQLRSARTGETFRDRANTSLTLIREGESYRLYELATPLIFGLSDPSEVATSDTLDRGTDEIIEVDEDGEIKIVTPDDSEELDDPDSDPAPGIPHNIREGSVDLSVQVYADGSGIGHGEAYSLFDYTKKGIYATMTFGNELGSFVVFGDEVEAGEILGSGPISSVTSVPAEMGFLGEDSEPEEGRLYALKLIDGTYAVLQLSDVLINDDEGGIFETMTFQYRHQRNGTPNF